MDGTDQKIDTPLARGRSRVVRSQSSIEKRARELMECAARLNGRVYVEPPPRVPRVDLERQRAAAELRTHEVYFLYSCNRIKIGTSRRHNRRVVYEIAPYCPAPLIVLGTIPGGQIIESQTHQRFSEAWAFAEWFDLTPDLRSYLSDERCWSASLSNAEISYRGWLHEQIAHQEMHNASNR